jgi:hypothetical protein
LANGSCLGLPSSDSGGGESVESKSAIAAKKEGARVEELFVWPKGESATLHSGPAAQTT